MLTKSDLRKIGDVLDNRLEEKLEKSLKPIKNELQYIKKLLSSYK